MQNIHTEAWKGQKKFQQSKQCLCQYASRPTRLWRTQLLATPAEDALVPVVTVMLTATRLTAVSARPAHGIVLVTEPVVRTLAVSPAMLQWTCNDDADAITACVSRGAIHNVAVLSHVPINYCWFCPYKLLLTIKHWSSVFLILLGKLGVMHQHLPYWRRRWRFFSGFLNSMQMQCRTSVDWRVAWLGTARYIILLYTCACDLNDLSKCVRLCLIGLYPIAPIIAWTGASGTPWRISKFVAIIINLIWIPSKKPGR